MHVLATWDEHEPSREANRDPEPDSEPGAATPAERVSPTAPAGLTGNPSCQSCYIRCACLEVSATKRRLMYHYGGST